MKPATRACVAYVAARLITQTRASSVYDYGRSKYLSVDGDISDKNVNVYDYGRGCYISGSGHNGEFDLYDYGNSRYVQLKVRGRHFKGYDYDTSQHFSGEVSGGAISF